MKSLRIEEEGDSGPSVIAATEAGRGIPICCEGVGFRPEHVKDR